MVNIITWYECEVCRQQYITQEDAERCESRGREKPLPRGLLYGAPANPKSFYADIAFAIANSTDDGGHFINSAMWACRNNNAGDSLGKDLCGPGPERLEYVKAPTKKDLKHSATIRLVRWMLAHKVVPLVHTGGGRVVPLTQYCEETGIPFPATGGSA